MEDEQLREIARHRAKFKQHLFTFIVVNIFLTIVNVQTSPEVNWEKWVALSWGLGVTLHGLFTYFGSSHSLEEREYQRLKAHKKAA